MASIVTALSLAAILLCAVLASPVPSEEGRDANASAPSNFLNCANGVGQGNGMNNCSMPQAPTGVPSGMPSGIPEGWGQIPQGPPQGGIPQQPPQISQGIDCATAVGQGNGFNNCSNIIQAPPSGYAQGIGNIIGGGSRSE